MSRYTKGTVLYRSALIDFQGGKHPVVFPARVSTVNPRRDGEGRLSHVYNIVPWEGAHHPDLPVFGVPESELFADPASALQAAMRAALAESAGVI